jgi:hypothetical protein
MDPVTIVAIVIVLWLASGQDRVATPLRAAIRSGARGAFGAGNQAAAARWAAGATGRAERRQARTATRRGRAINALGTFLVGLGRILGGTTTALGAATAGAVTAAGQSWADERAAHARHRATTGPGRIENLLRRIWGRLEAYLEARAEQAQDSDQPPAVAPQAPAPGPGAPAAPQPAPAAGGSTNPPSKENRPMTNLDVPDMNALRKVAETIASGIEAMTLLASYAETSRGLPNALAFDPGKHVVPALMAMAESTPDPDKLKAWAENAPALVWAIAETQRVISGVAETEVHGHTDQLVPTS